MVMPMPDTKAEGLPERATSSLAPIPPPEPPAKRPGRLPLSLDQKVKTLGLGMAWGSIGEAIAYIAGLAMHFDGKPLGHGFALLISAVYTIYRFWGPPINLRQCLKA